MFYIRRYCVFTWDGRDMELQALQFTATQTQWMEYERKFSDHCIQVNDLTGKNHSDDHIIIDIFLIRTDLNVCGRFLLKTLLLDTREVSTFDTDQSENKKINFFLSIPNASDFQVKQYFTATKS